MSWAKAKLGKICKIEKGSTGINKAIPGVYPMVVTSEARKSHNEYQFDDDAVIIPLVSSTGHGHKSLKRIHFQQGKFALGSILCAVIPKDKTLLNAAYLYRYLDLHKDNELVARMKGMANVTLPIKEIAQIEIPLPPIKEQIEFTKKYYRLESNSESLSAQFASQLDLLKKLRQQILQDAVQGKLAPQDPNDEPASVLLQKIKAEKEQLIREKKIRQEKPMPAIKPEDIPFEIPENWVWCRLGDLAYITSGSTPSHEAFVGNGIPYLKMYNLRNQKIDFFYQPQYITEEVHNGQLKRCRAFPGDLLMNIVGPPLGKIAIIPEELPQCNFNQAAVLIRPFIKAMNIFIFWYLNEMSEINSIETKGVAGQNNISVTQAHNMRIPLPPQSEQHRIVTKVEQLMTLCNELEQTMKQNQAYTRQLLQVALKEALEPGS
jgi:type I restriction enzyme S subunit